MNTNYVAYFDWGTDRPRFQDQDKFAFMSVFSFPDLFEEVEVTIYGESKRVSYYCANFLWKPIENLIRFVWVMDGEHTYILMCSDLELSPTEIITIYACRWKIETMFFALKHWLGGFAYHFWSRAFPKLKRDQPLDVTMCSPEARQQLLKLSTRLSAS